MTGLLQRNPDSEEPEAPLVELGVPERILLVAPVVDRATYPLPTGCRKRPTPVRPRWRASAPGRRAVAPRGSVEVAALGVAMPQAGTTRSAWSDAWRSAGSTRSVVSGTTGSSRSARTPGTARSARCGSAGTALAVEIPEWLPARSGRRAMIAARVGWRRSWSGAGRTRTHTQRRSSKSASDGSPRHQLLQIHCPSPDYLCIQRTFLPTYRTLDSLAMNQLREASGKLLRV